MHRLKLIVSVLMFFVVGSSSSQWFFGGKLSIPSPLENRFLVIEKQISSEEYQYKNLIAPLKPIPIYLWRTFQNSVNNTFHFITTPDS